MKVLIATGIFPPDIGGPATYSKLLAEELTKRGYSVTVLTYGDKKQRLQVANYTLQVVSQQMPKGVRHLVYFWHALQQGARADVIYAQDAVSAGLPTVLAARLLRKRFVLKIVGDHAWEQATQRFGVRELLDDFLLKKYGWRVELLKKIERFTAWHADRIVVPSTYLKTIVGRWGISEEKTEVVYNAVSANVVSISKEEARKKLGMNGFVLLSVGRLVPWKGFGMLVSVAKQLSSKIANLTLVIIGEGPERKNIELQITNYGLEKDIHLMGAVPKETLALYLRAADVFCLNTVYEGFSHQIIEALVSGIPVITTDAGGNKEVVRHEENALVARYNDITDWEKQIMRLYNDTALRGRLSRNYQTGPEVYSVEDMVSKTESILRNS